MWNTKLDSISPLISTHIPPPPGESSDMHYGQTESSDFMLCNTFNRQLLGVGQHRNVFLAGAPESWVGGRLIASLLPHTNKLPGWSVWKRRLGLCVYVRDWVCACVKLTVEGKFDFRLALWHWFVCVCVCVCVCVWSACIFISLCTAELWIQAAPISFRLHPQTFLLIF